MEKTIYNINLSPQCPRLNAALLPELIERYLSDMARRVQAKTVTGYQFKLQYVLDWWREAGPQSDWLLGVDELADLGKHLESLTTQKGEPLGYHSRNDVLRRLRQVLRWAFERGYVPIDLSVDVPEARGEPPLHKPVELDALEAMLQTALTTSHPIRNQAIVATLAGTGIRCEECAALQTNQVTLYADGSGYISLTLTKNDKPRFAAVDEPTGRYLRAWLSVLGERSQWLFPSRIGSGYRPLSPSGIYKVVVDLAEAAGVRAQVCGPHDLRRMFATQWNRKLRGNGYGQLLQKQLGHASWATTEKYSLQDIGDVLEVMRQEAASPMAQLAERGGIHLNGEAWLGLSARE